MNKQKIIIPMNTQPKYKMTSFMALWKRGRGLRGLWMMA